MAYIEKEELLKTIFPYNGVDKKTYTINAKAVETAILDAPTADVVEVVFCKDCKHYREYERPVEDFDGFCVVNENEYDKDFYCQYGERREK